MPFAILIGMTLTTVQTVIPYRNLVIAGLSADSMMIISERQMPPSSSYVVDITGR